VNKSRRIRWMSYLACMGKIINVYEILVGKPEGERLLGRRRHVWEDNIKIYRKEVECEDVDWLLLAQVRVQWLALVNTVLHQSP
jgi:hypothetical protein